MKSIATAVTLSMFAAVALATEVARADEPLAPRAETTDIAPTFPPAMEVRSRARVATGLVLAGLGTAQIVTGALWLRGLGSPCCSGGADFRARGIEGGATIGAGAVGLFTGLMLWESGRELVPIAAPTSLRTTASIGVDPSRVHLDVRF